MEKRKFGLVYTVLAVILCVAIAGTTMSGMMFKRMDKVNAAIEELGKEEIKETQEDNVMIAEQYLIKSTTQISDAYKSGDESKLSEEDKETLKMASDVLKEIIKDGMSDYEKEEAVYLWIVDNIRTGGSSLAPVSNDPSTKATPHGVLKNKQAVCVGYATTFRLFMHMLDIECKVVHNNEGYHSWNMVKLEDDWYITDCYMDAGSAKYCNFNMSDEMAGRADMHDWDKNYFPAAVGRKYNYVFMNAKPLDDLMKIPKEIRKSCEKGGLPIFFNIGKDPDGKKTAILENMQSNSYSYISNYGDITFTMYEGENKDLFLAIYITNYNGQQQNNSSLSEEENQKIIDALQKAFEGYEGEGMVNPPAEGGQD